jgi:oxaloacetate decarboxylase beta subunit
MTAFAQTGGDYTFLIMIVIACILLYLGIVKKYEPLLLVPIGMGVLLANFPGGAMGVAQATSDGYVTLPDGTKEIIWDMPLHKIAHELGLMNFIYYMCIKTGFIPPIIFMGVGALTDFGPMLRNLRLSIFGAGAQFGIFAVLLCSLAMGFTPQQAASLGIIGGADGPTAIFLSSKLSPNLMGAIAVCAYSYMALVPLIQPPLMRLLTTKKERLIKMKPAREVSQTERILFPIVGLLLTTFIVPSGLPLLGMLFFGNLLKESGKTTRLAKTAGAALNDIVVMLLGLTVGCSTQASEFLTMNTIYIFAIGAGAFIIATMSGVCFVKVMNIFLPKDKKLNPLIGNAGVSAVPMAARISNNLGLEYDRHNFLLMHAMGPNVAGVIGSAVAAGALLGFLS